MSTLKADTIQNTSGGAATLTKQAALKAHIQLDQETGTIADSLNQSAITDDSDGSTRFNYTNNMADANYSVTASAGNVDTNTTWIRNVILFSDNSGSYKNAPTTSNFYMQCLDNAGNLDDFPYVCHQVAGDLA